MLHVALHDPAWAEDLGPLEGIEAHSWHPRDPAPDIPFDVVVAPYIGAAGCIGAVAALPSVRLVQLLTAGYDGILEQLPARIAVANAAGVHDTSTAELALALTLAAQRGIPDFARAQESGTWLRPGFLPSLADRRVLILGYGRIGRAIAARLLPFETEVMAVASRAREGDELIEHVHGVADLPSVLPRAEVVIVVAPLTESTRGLVGADFLAALPDDALVVNVARGPILDTQAALAQTGRLRFALDVTDPEPLPPEHPLWRAPGVLISPHVGGPSSAFRPRALALLREQLGRLASGQEPAHVVGRGRAGG